MQHRKHPCHRSETAASLFLLEMQGCEGKCGNAVLASIVNNAERFLFSEAVQCGPELPAGCNRGERKIGDAQKKDPVGILRFICKYAQISSPFVMSSPPMRRSIFVVEPRRVEVLMGWVIGHESDGATPFPGTLAQISTCGVSIWRRGQRKLR